MGYSIISTISSSAAVCPLHSGDTLSQQRQRSPSRQYVPVPPSPDRTQKVRSSSHSIHRCQNRASPRGQRCSKQGADTFRSEKSLPVFSNPYPPSYVFLFLHFTTVSGAWKYLLSRRPSTAVRSAPYRAHPPAEPSRSSPPARCLSARRPPPTAFSDNSAYYSGNP